MKKLLLIITVLLTFNINAQEIKFGKVSKEELEEKFNPKDSTANATYLLKKRKTFFNYNPDNGFTIVTKFHERIKVYNKEGFEFALKKIPFYKPESGDREKISALKAYTFNIENNKITKQKLAKNGIFEERLSKFRCQKKLLFQKLKKVQ